MQYCLAGPTDNLWSSPCFIDLSNALIESLFEANSEFPYIITKHLTRTTGSLAPKGGYS